MAQQVAKQQTQQQATSNNGFITADDWDKGIRCDVLELSGTSGVVNDPKDEPTFYGG